MEGYIAEDPLVACGVFNLLAGAVVGGGYGLGGATVYFETDSPAASAPSVCGDKVADLLGDGYLLDTVLAPQNVF